MGVISQSEVNLIGDVCDKMLFKNPSRSVLVLIPPLLVGADSGGSLRKDIRRLEDKLIANKIELRPFTLNLSLDDLHKNRELPSAYICYLGVPDSTLPLKGTAHRSVRGAPEIEQSLPTPFPGALSEKEFVVPGESLLSNDTRRNLTDLQETSQWIGGGRVPTAILTALFSGVKAPQGAVILHPTAYDGCLELAGMKLGHAILSSSLIEANYKCTNEIVKSHLLQAWKSNQAPMDKYMPRYKKDPSPEDLPQGASKPTLKICQVAEDSNKLILPKDIRHQFLSCPIWGQEWRDVLTNFDKSWGAPLADTPSPSKPSPMKTETPSPIKQEGDAEYDWKSAFPGEPDMFEKLKEKVGGAENFTEVAGPTSTTTFIIAPGPSLYVHAKEPVKLPCNPLPFITHGGGTWLVGQKATKFEANNQGKAIPCSFTDDSAPVVLEDDGSDTNPMVLCAALQAVEKSGMIDFSLAGHTCCRPPEVQQGRCDDRFYVAPTDEKLLWKANAVPAKSLKASNLASHFSYQQLKASPLVLVWRLRKYVTEKTVGAAKPLWYLPGDLGMIQGGAQRVI
ncbi:unnamed protein product [Durusdinium trenchii]|uniref:Uncharacterized protein n=1 Tax=Durusdinium trenchii TaxID=1381693 RepID=A0ABP0SAA3_9DINO